MAYIQLIIYMLCLIDTFSSQAIVNTKYNQIIGKTVNFNSIELNQYLGIPYAEPPVGDRRFKKPVPPRIHPKVQLAYNLPPACWQRSEYPFPWYDSRSTKRENCLFLNIWTPSGSGSADNPKAVIYWIHGGDFRYGSNAQSVYQGIPLAALGNVVVVTVNYRLGPFGYFVSGTKDEPGNLGLWDVLKGLQWVNDNIIYFGGDNSRITIAGEGTGSTMVGLLSISPLAEHLFQRQIMQSGSPVDTKANDGTRNAHLSQLVAERLLCANKTFTLKDNPKAVVNCLKKVPAEGLSSVHAGISPHFTATFTPQYGDELLPANPSTAILNGQFNCKDVLIGRTRDEGSYILSSENPRVFGFFGELNPRISKKNGKHLIKKYFQNLTDLEGVVNYYLPSDLPKDDFNTIRHQVYTSMGDKSISCPTVYYADKCAESGGNVYSYLWDYRPTRIPWAPWTGVPHFSDVQFIFGAPLLNPNIYDSEEVQLSLETIEIWSSFAKTGEPSTSWPLYSKDNPLLKFFGPKFDTEEYNIDPSSGNCEFLKPYFGF